MNAKYAKPLRGAAALAAVFAAALLTKSVRGVFSALVFNALLALFSVHLLKKDGALGALRIKNSAVSRQVLIGCALALIFSCAVFGVFLMFGRAGVLPPADRRFASIAGTALLQALIACAEELFFRFYLAQLLPRRALSAALSAAAFALLHFAVNGNFIQLALSFAVALYYSAALRCVKDASAVSLITAHALHNLIFTYLLSI